MLNIGCPRKSQHWSFYHAQTISQLAGLTLISTWTHIFFLVLLKEMVELSSAQSLVGMNSKCENQSKWKCKSYESCVCIVGFWACGCQKKSEACETECRHVAVQRGKYDQNAHARYFVLNVLWNGKSVKALQEGCQARSFWKSLNAIWNLLANILSVS